MKHPFALNNATELETKQTALVRGGSFSPNDGKAQDARASIFKPVKPPFAFTQAVGEDGGHMPDPDLL